MAITVKAVIKERNEGNEGNEQVTLGQQAYREGKPQNWFNSNSPSAVAAFEKGWLLERLVQADNAAKHAADIVRFAKTNSDKELANTRLTVAKTFAQECRAALEQHETKQG